MTIQYVVGDATRPQGPGPKVLVHCVNDIGKFGAGFALAINSRWSRVAESYREWHRTGSSPLVLGLTPSAEPTTAFHLGAVQFVEVEPSLWVANLIGQHKTISDGEKVPVRYEALEMGLQTVAVFCDRQQASVHAPRLGAGLAGGRWDRIEALLKRTLRGRSVTIYTLP
jgi:O-acetyl-ADP-ribose deacetylase (regulator of RNase III)